MLELLCPKTEDRPSGALRDALRAARAYFLHAALFSAFLNLLYLAPTFFMLQVYDRVVPTRGVATLGMLVAILTFAVLTIAGLDLVRNRLMVRAGERLDADLSGAILDAQLRLGAAPARSGPIMREFDTFRQTLTGAGMLALFDLPWMPIYFLACLLLHPALAALAFGSAVVLSVLSVLNERATKGPIGRANMMAQASHAGIETVLGASGVVAALGMREALVRRHLRERAASSGLAAQASMQGAGYLSAIKAIRLLVQSLALGLGVLLAIEGDISAGAIFAASLLVSRALQPIEQINGAWKNLISARAAYRSLVELFRVAGETRQPTRLPEAIGALSVESLSIATPARDLPLLNGVNFRMEPGESLGIVGPSGAGKSTLVKALAGVMPSADGAIRIDGAALSAWPEAQLGRAIGYVPQEPSLFRGTIKENIARFQTELAMPGSLDEAVVRAAQACGAHDFILRLPQGYDTQLGAGGTGLSSGQAQRIALARALFGGPKVVIMDEPNAHLDSDGEAQLAATIETLKADKVTVIIVAHRIGILANVDRLMVMRDGKVELLGPRHAVLTRLQGPRDAKPAAPVAAPAAAVA